MTSFRQIEANRRNALRSTECAPPWLSGETVITVLEDAEEYEAFEAKLISEYDPRTILERELVVRLTSLAWRLRRATAIETGLLQIRAEAGLRLQPGNIGGIILSHQQVDECAGARQLGIAVDHD